jgi:hypothetical protein
VLSFSKVPSLDPQHSSGATKPGTSRSGKKIGYRNGFCYYSEMGRKPSELLQYIYNNHDQIYLRDLVQGANYTATAAFTFGHNPRTRDYTHVGAAEMLAGLSQAAYCMVNSYRPELLIDDVIARCYFRRVQVTFTKMLAPETDASLTLQMAFQPDGLPRFDFDGFIRGTVECGLAARHDSVAKQMAVSEGLSQSVQRTLRTFYNNGSELTLKSLTPTAPRSWTSHSRFDVDSRLRICQYSTTTQLIVGLSQIAFAVVGEVNQREAGLRWSDKDFLDSMGDQALVKLSYVRPQSVSRSLALDSAITSSRTLRGCKFVRVALGGDLSGTMDSMLSPRVPVKTLKASSSQLT